MAKYRLKPIIVEVTQSDNPVLSNEEGSFTGGTGCYVIQLPDGNQWACDADTLAKYLDAWV